MKLRHAFAVLLLTCWSSAHALYTISIQETGGNVVVSGSGTINTTGLVASVTIACGADFGGLAASALCIGPNSNNTIYPSALTPALANLTTSGATFYADSASGAPVYLGADALYLPPAYVSGAPLSSSSTYNSTSLATMGLTPGTRTLRLPSGDSIVINIGAAAPVAAPVAVPTLGEYGLMGLGSLLAMAGTLMARRRQKR